VLAAAAAVAALAALLFRLLVAEAGRLSPVRSQAPAA